MSREILFRATAKDLNIVVTGYYFYSETENKHYIIGDSKDYGFKKIEVIPETVGQYTGLNDKNGVKIFEGDIVKMYSEVMPEWVVTIKKVEWYKEEAQWSLGQRDARMIWEIIGNIHEVENER